MSATFRWPVIFLAFALATTPSFASTRVAIYGIIDDIAFEPADLEPDRVWISGVFVVPHPISSGLHRPPTRGNLYFSLYAANPDGTRADWQALRAVAGTGQVIGFGQYWMPCSSSPSRAALGPLFPDSANCSFDAAVEQADRTRAMPRPYPAPSDEGVVTVFDQSDDLCPRFGRPSVQIVADLRNVHSPGSVRDEPPPCREWIGLLASSDLATAFSLQQRDREWADATETLILKSLADVAGLRLADVNVQCRDTVCRIHLAFPTAEYQEAAGNRLATDALVNLPGFAPGGKVDPGYDAATIDYYLQRRKPPDPADTRSTR
jgi:hypothetical protein